MSKNHSPKETLALYLQRDAEEIAILARDFSQEKKKEFIKKYVKWLEKELKINE